MSSFHRRDFLRTSTLVATGAATVPGFLARSARAAADAKPNDRILVVVQMLGGNDGLNTVVPFGMAGYARARKALRIADDQVQKISPEIGLHPSLGGLSKLLEDGKLAVLQGVGYPNPDRSHFRSMEIWETARTEAGALETGWLGRALDARPAAPGADPPALNVDRRKALALKSRHTEVPALEGLAQYRLQLAGDAAQKRGERNTLEDAVKLAREADDPLLGFIRRSTLTAYESSRRLESLAAAKSDSKYPEYGLAKRLELIAQIIKAEFSTRIYYTALDGFDTHANQLGSHAALLTELGDSIAAFHADLAKAGQADRVSIVTFSEFGRRVLENASAGTDHGAAAPMFVVGPVAQAGLIGAHPSLDNLDDGDLKHHTDFRQVYASVLEQWLGMPSAPILGGGFPPLKSLFHAKS